MPKTRRDDAVGARPRRATCATPRALSISASTRASGTAARTACTCAADSALGSITAAMRASRSRRRSSAKPLDCGVVDAHDDARTVGLGGLPRPLRDRLAGLALGRGGDGVLEVEHDASAPLASALAKRSGRLPGTNR